MENETLSRGAFEEEVDDRRFEIPVQLFARISRAGRSLTRKGACAPQPLCDQFQNLLIAWMASEGVQV
jgi:hypothetical protein